MLQLNLKAVCRQSSLLLGKGWGCPGASVVKNPPASARDTGAPGSRSPAGGNGIPPPLPDFLHEEGHGQRNLAGIVHGVAKSQTQAEHNAGAQQRSAFPYDGLRLDEAHLYFNLSSLFKDPITKYSHIPGYF